MFTRTMNLGLRSLKESQLVLQSFPVLLQLKQLTIELKRYSLAELFSHNKSLILCRKLLSMYFIRQYRKVVSLSQE